MSNRLPPVTVPFTDKRGLIDKNWLLFLQNITASLPDAGSSVVSDGSNSTYGHMTLYQGLDLNKSGTAPPGAIYFALDTGKIYFSSGSLWVALSEELTGDVLKDKNSNVTSLKQVFAQPGKFGSSNQIPVLTIDAAGRITSISLETVNAEIQIAPPGQNGELSFNDNGVFSGTPGIIYSAGGLFFEYPEITRDSLSPLIQKGDIFVRDELTSTRLPVGTDGQRITADSTELTGLKWITTRLEKRFFYSDVSPWLIGVIPANKIIKSCSLTVLDSFAQNAFISVGTLLNEQQLMETSDNLPYIVGSFSVIPGIKYAVDTEVYLYIIPGTSTSGEGEITIELE